MEKKIIKFLAIFMALINRIINKEKFKRKIFCIGLHKTGTSSLYEFAIRYGCKATHSTNWSVDSKKLGKFEFFCDGGSHFDGQNEFDFKSLSQEYPTSLFILQTRDTRSWIISKLKHAGWNKKTIVEPDNEIKILHSDWKYKSLLTIENFIRHKYRYEQKVIEYFKENDPHRLLTINITNKKSQTLNIERLINFLGWRSIYKIALPHTNKAKSTEGLSKEVIVFIDTTIAACKSERTGKN